MFSFSNLFEKFFRYVLIALIVIVLLQYILPRTSIYFRTSLFQPLFGTILKEKDIILVTGESKKLYLKTINKRMSFSSTDFKVAYVNQLGIVTGSRPGLCFIKVSVDKKVLKCRIRVIELNHTSLKMTPGDHKWLNVRGCIFGESYKSSDESVVTVSFLGRVTAVSKGNAIITVKAFGRSIKCKVIVN